MKEDIYYLREANKEAIKAKESGNTPFGGAYFGGC